MDLLFAEGLAFVQAALATLEREGPETADPRDPGGVTRWGISQRANPDVDVAHLDVVEALALYRHRYWLPLGCGQMPLQIARKVFDMAVHVGCSSAIRVLQRALNRVGTVPTLEEDGQPGPLTRSAVTRVDAAQLLEHLSYEQAAYYEEVIARHPDLGVYRNGWLARARVTA